MRFCKSHWDALREAIERRGLSSLVAESGEQAARNAADVLQRGQNIDNYDPLMAAHWAIAGNALTFAESVGGNPLAMMVGNPERPEWECPIYFLNFLSDEHDRTCQEPTCKKPRGYRYDWMIERAADDQVETWKAMKP